MACYGLGTAKGIEFNGQADLMDWLKKAHFPVPHFFNIVIGIDNVINSIKKIEEK